jgi:hypothetical protein
MGIEAKRNKFMFEPTTNHFTKARSSEDEEQRILGNPHLLFLSKICIFNLRKVVVWLVKVGEACMFDRGRWF